MNLYNNRYAMDDTMSNAIAIRLLEKDNNRRGDAFWSLALNDLFPLAGLRWMCA